MVGNSICVHCYDLLMNSTIQTTISFLLLTLKFKMKCLNVILLLLASPFCDSNNHHLQSRIKLGKN